MENTFNDKKLNNLVISLQTAVNDVNELQIIESHNALDNYIKLICQKQSTRPSNPELEKLKQLIDAAIIKLSQLKLNLSKRIIKQKQNAKAIAKYRSI